MLNRPLSGKCLAGGRALEGGEDFAVEEVVVEREMETIDAQIVKLEHTVEDSLGAADETAGIAFVGIEQGQTVVERGPHAVGAGGAQLAALDHDGVLGVEHRGEDAFGFGVGLAA